ncbi:MAG: LysM domain-containing protein [Saprospiraceae bacterium]|nr:MAG: LysM domain-containing protein [Saprospiraceae bacterium]
MWWLVDGQQPKSHITGKTMKKHFLTLTCWVLLSLSAQATGDSLQYLTPKDTVFLQVDEMGNKVFLHHLEKGQTLYSMARFYGLKIETIFAFNPNINAAGPIPQGLSVKVPIPNPAVVKCRDSLHAREHYAPVMYVVKRGDTFYHIAKTCFGVPLDTLYKRNHLSSFIVHEGQCLFIGWLSTAGIADSLQIGNSLGVPTHSLSFIFQTEKAAGTMYSQNGAAYWQREKKGATDFYALHRTAPVGSVIQITNPMKRKVAYAKVIGKIPDRAYGDDVIVVLSPSIAKLLGAKDPRFFVEVQYFR